MGAGSSFNLSRMLLSTLHDDRYCRSSRMVQPCALTLASDARSTPRWGLSFKPAGSGLG